MKSLGVSVPKWIRLGPAARVSLGLSALMVSLLLVLDLALGLFPDQTDLLAQWRTRISEDVASQAAASLDSGDRKVLTLKLHEALKREPQLRSLAVRQVDGTVLAQAGDHARHWSSPPAGKSSLNHVRIPLNANNQHWGDIEISFQKAGPQTMWQWLQQPGLFLYLVLGLGGFALFSLYLRRAFEYLDPQSAIPDRVRLAFDAFSEGVMIVDTAGRIMLANAAFRQWVAREQGSLLGRAVRDLAVLSDALPSDPKAYPWMKAMAQGRASQGEYLELAHPGGDPIKAIVNCSPIQDGRSKVRGCIATFDNVTEFDRVNKKLQAAVDELQKSNAQIEDQNRKLQELAIRDPLTGCLNRRAFFERVGPLFDAARETGRGICCVMTDIDHFKQFNDRYGHAIGDQVLKIVSKNLTAGLREEDLLCRYGGEEFCIILTDTDLDVARGVAERLRSTIESRAGMGVRSIPGLRVTSSFGVAALAADTRDIESLIAVADNALYEAKRGGRNRVQVAKAESVAA